MNHVLQKSAFMRLLFPFIFGIVLSYYFQIPLKYPGIIAALLSCLTIISYFIKQYLFRCLFGYLLACLCTWGGLCLTSSFLQQSTWEIPEKQQTYVLQLTENPVEKPRSWMYKAQIKGSEDSLFQKTAKKQVIVYLPKNDMPEKPVAGDGIVIRTTFKKPESKPNDSFDYAAYLKKQGISAIGFVRKGDWRPLPIKSSWIDRLKFSAYDCQRYLVEKLHEIIPESKNVQVGEALFIGYRAELSQELIMSFSATGASHILSISGLHLSILYVILCFIFGLFGSTGKIRSFFRLSTLLLLWFFSFITGLTPSIVRSCIMICFIGMGTVLNKRSFTLNTVAASAFFMLLYNPMYLFDVGFQLSYVAVVSIVVINPYLIGLLEFKSKIMSYFWELTCVSISAQLGTAPIAVFYFHQFPLIFILTNIFAIPVTGILLVLIPLSTLLQIIYPCPSWVFWPVNAGLDFFVSVIQLFEKIPWAVLSGLQLDIWGICSVYAAFLFLFLLLLKKRMVYLYFLVLLVALQLFYYL